MCVGVSMENSRDREQNNKKIERNEDLYHFLPRLLSLQEVMCYEPIHNNFSYVHSQIIIFFFSYFILALNLKYKSCGYFRKDYARFLLYVFIKKSGGLNIVFR
jgi:hypothetical protein